MASIDVTDLSKSFGSLRALQSITMSVRDGEFLVMLGPSAAGKTTTLKCLTGLEKPDHGSVRLDGKPVDHLSPAQRDVALVFQTYALYPRKTVFENMAFPLEARGWSRERIRSRVTEVADKLQIGMLLNRRPAQLSGGQQQRVALGRAMVRDPQVFFMDEPLTNLDFALRVQMRAELKRQQKELEKTFFYVTNDQVEAMSMADRIAVLNQGILQQVDVPETIYNHPANLFVARFVGNPRMNTLACRFDAQANRLVGEDGAWTLPISFVSGKVPGVEALKDKSLVFGIRAEDIEVSLRPQEAAIQGEIYVLEPLGDRILIDVKLGRSMIKARVSPTFQANEGNPVWLRFDSERFHLFDEADGRSLT